MAEDVTREIVVEAELRNRARETGERVGKLEPAEMHTKLDEVETLIEGDAVALDNHWDNNFLQYHDDDRVTVGNLEIAR